MVQIPLHVGDNYISFPEAPAISMNFRQIFTDLVINNIGIDTSGNRKFYKFNPILNNFTIVDLDLEYIEEGRGYLLIAKPIDTIIPSIIYDSIKYSIPMTFDRLKSMLLQGWNLVSTNSDILTPPNWCNLIDANTRLPATKLEPKNAYWIRYDSCIEYGIGAELILNSVVSILFLYVMLKELKWV